MRIFRHYSDLPADARGAVVAIGNFDGVHKGHQAVINEAGTIARAEGRPWAVMSFEPHPEGLFKPDAEPFRLSTMRTKARMIEDMGVDELLVQQFDFDFASMDPSAFIEDVIVQGLGACHVVSGYDFHFGRKRAGDCNALLQAGRDKGFGFTAVQQVVDEAGEVYSSTRVRECLKAADPKGAATILGRAFEFDGRIEHGDARGRSIGFPTANMHMGDYVQPAIGVYAIQAGVDEGPDTVWHDGAANFGRRPTFDGEGVVMEVHLFDFDGDLYGKHLRVKLIDYLRPEQKFDGLDALKTQIAEDCNTAREILAKTRRS